ncbi:MAG: hypothetical protein ACXQS8_00400 [Candidatus Helarchaeales archaeon]
MEKKFLPIIGGLGLSIGAFIFIVILGTIKVGNMLLIPREYIDYFVYILPGPLYTDIILIFALPILFFFLFYLTVPFFFVFWLKIHRLIKWRAKYGIYKLPTKARAAQLYYRSFIISVFSFSISSMLVQFGLAGLFRAGNPLDLGGLILFQGESIFLGTFILVSFMIIIFFPIWILEDSGVVSYRVFPGERFAPDIEGVHSVFMILLQGYAGFTSILTLIYYVAMTLIVVNPIGSILMGIPVDAAILTPVLLILLPYITTGIVSIPILLYEKYLPKILAKLEPRLEKLGIKEIKIPTFDEARELFVRERES